MPGRTALDQAKELFGSLRSGVTRGIGGWQASNRQRLANFNQSRTVPLKYADPILGFGSGLAQGLGGFTGIDQKIPINPNYRTQTVPGKISEFGGGLVGFALGPGKIIGPLESAVSSKIAPYLPKTLPAAAPIISRISNAIVRRTAPAVVAEATSSLPLSLIQSKVQNEPLAKSYATNLGLGLTSRGGLAALGAGGKLALKGISAGKTAAKETEKTLFQQFLSSALREEQNLVNSLGQQVRTPVGRYGPKAKTDIAVGSGNFLNEGIPLLRVVVGGRQEQRIPPSKLLENPDLIQFVKGPANAAAEKLYKLAFSGGFINPDELVRLPSKISGKIDEPSLLKNQSGQLKIQPKALGNFQQPQLQTDPLGKTASRSTIPLSKSNLSTALSDIISQPINPPGNTTFNPDQYVKELSKKTTVKGQSLFGKIRQKADTFLKDTKRALVDSNAPIEDVLSNAQKEFKFSVLPKYDISNQIDRVYRSPAIAGQFVKDQGFDRVIRDVDNIDNLDQYLIAKHAQTLAKKGIETGRNLQKDTQLLQAFGTRYDAAAQQVNAYSRKLLDYSVDSGLISRDLAQKLVNEYPDYVPFQRVMDIVEGGGKIFNPKGVASLNKQTVVQKIKGSTRDIESPIASLLAKTNDAFVQGERNKTARILAGYKQLPGLRDLIKELPEGKSAQHTFSYLENGVKKTFETTPEISEAAKRLNVQQLNILGKILAAPVRVAKVGITGINIPFIGANLVKDQVYSSITSGKSFSTSALANPVNFVQALFSAVKHDDLYQDLVRQGAGGTSFDIARDATSQTIQKIRASKSLGSRIKYTVRHPVEMFRAIEDTIARSEELTRIQQYKGTKDALLREGRTLADAEILAAKAARENTVNFARKGDYGTVLNSAFLYLNAGIQGSRTTLRTFKKRPGSTAMKIGLGMFLPIATSTAWNLSDPLRKEAYGDIQDFEKENNLIIVPPNPVKNERGEWNVIKIPLPQGLSKLTALVRRPMESAQGLDPLKFSEIANALIGTASPVDLSKRSLLSTAVPQAVKVPVELATNQNLFTGSAIIPKSLEGVSPQYQVKDYTSGTARKVGNALKVSPLQVEHGVRGTLGGVGSQLLNASDQVLNRLGVIPKEQVGGQSVTEGVGARFLKARGGKVEDQEYDQEKSLEQQQKDEKQKLLTSLSKEDRQALKEIKQAEKGDERSRQSSRREAENIYQNVISLPTTDQQRSYVNGLQKSGQISPEVLTQLKRVVNERKKLGGEAKKTGMISSVGKTVQLSGTTNSSKAKFVITKLKGLSSKQEKNTYLKSLKEDGILTEGFLKTLKEEMRKQKGLSVQSL